ncbi:hypothetical protein [Marinicrinis lubricantis]|uniref:Uncharacterized protein n=1 Tax=Marinicrinis lubricantis TaxID=2086470 RepID=A0ABW1IL52_9BACL
MEQKLLTIIHALKGITPQLSPKQPWSTEWDEAIQNLEQSVSVDLEKRLLLKCVQSGLHLWNESLDLSHTLSQNIDNPTGSYWHGIMHRMEQDYPNAGYWFRQVGEHPAFPSLLQSVQSYFRSISLEHLPVPVKEYAENLKSSTRWDPFRFIQLIELQETTLHHEETDQLLRDLQRIEIVQLLMYCIKPLDEQVCNELSSML